ncbi:MAG TPA: hypothetical protein VH281_06000 [Gaiellaceae bacterium]|jgi:hypothetical protein
MTARTGVAGHLLADDGQGSVAAMLIRVSDPGLAEDLREHFRRSGFSADRRGVDALDISRPDAPEPGQERREIEVHLRVWQATHPGVAAVIVDTDA